MDVWFMPFQDDAAQERQMLEHPSDVSSYASISTSPQPLSEYELRSGSGFRGAMPLSPTEAMDEIWLQSRRESSSSATHQNEKSQTSSRRRAQNRAAQRAFRERKEKRARDLEEQLAKVTDKYKDLEIEFHQLQQAYDKLQQTLELLTCDDEGRANGEQLRRFLDIIQGKARMRVKSGA
jgi:hypothetical protein